MPKVTITYVFEDQSDDEVNVEYRLESDPPFDKSKELTEAQRAALWFAENVSKQVMQEAAVEDVAEAHCPEGHCCGGDCHNT